MQKRLSKLGFAGAALPHFRSIAQARMPVVHSLSLRVGFPGLGKISFYSLSKEIFKNNDSQIITNSGHAG